MSNTDITKKRLIKEEQKATEDHYSSLIKDQPSEFQQINQPCLKKQPSHMLIELNDRAYSKVEQVWRNPQNADIPKNELLIDYFTSLIVEGKSATSRRTLTIETINRYIFCLNQIYLKGHLSLIELRNDVKSELEKGKGYEIDKKTLKRIIDKLAKDQLIKTVDFLVTLEAAEGNCVQSMVKTLVLDPNVSEQDAPLMQNPTIANPTNRIDNPKSSNTGLLGIKRENSRVSESLKPQYGLRARNKMIKYKEEESAHGMSFGSQRRESMDSNVEIIDASGIDQRQYSSALQVENEVVQIAPPLDKMVSGKFSVVDENTVKASKFVKIMEKVLKENTSRKVKNAFTLLLRDTIIKREDRDLSDIFKFDRDITLIKSFENWIKLPLKSQPELVLRPFNQKQNDQQLTPRMVYADYKSSKKGKQTSKMIEDEMDAFADNVLAELATDTSDNSSSPQSKIDISDSLIEMRSLVEQEVDVILKSEKGAKIYNFCISQVNGKKLQTKVDTPTVFETKRTILLQTKRISRHLINHGVQDFDSLSKKAFNIFSYEHILNELCKHGHVTVEKEANQVFIKARPSITDVYCYSNVLLLQDIQ